jgi:heat-inducible transcriptional repressor
VLRSHVGTQCSQAAIDADSGAADAIRELRQTASELDELLRKTSELLTQLTDCLSIVLPDDAPSVPMRSIGLSTLMQQPEFSQSLVLVPLLRMIEDDSLLVYVNRAAAAGEPCVRIGHENDDVSLGNVSVVASRFGGGEESGIVAVIGPTRMDYERVIAAVLAARRELDEI